MKYALLALLFVSPVVAQTPEAPETPPVIIEEPVAPLPTAPPTPFPQPKPLETVETIGYSVQKRPIAAHVFGDGPNVTLILSCVHGNETSTPELAQLLLAHLRKHPEILRGRRVVVVPVLNPDGLRVKSRRNANNVDINRNYPGTWRLPRRGEPFKPGTSPASEPETRAILKLVAQYPPQKVVSIHQPLHCLAYSGARSRPLALEMRKHNRYRISEGVGYPTPGGFGGYCENILKVPVVTLEFPWQSAQAAWKINAPALLAAIRFEVNRQSK